MAASVQQWFPFSLEPAVEQVIRRVDFSWCLGDPVVAELPGDAPFWIVRREKLDQLLAEQACQAGAERINGVTVDDVAIEQVAADSTSPTGYQYDENSNSIVFRSGSVPSPGQKIVIEYQPVLATQSTTEGK